MALLDGLKSINVGDIKKPLRLLKLLKFNFNLIKDSVIETQSLTYDDTLKCLVYEEE